MFFTAVAAGGFGGVRRGPPAFVNPQAYFHRHTARPHGTAADDGLPEDSTRRKHHGHRHRHHHRRQRSSSSSSSTNTAGGSDVVTNAVACSLGGTPNPLLASPLPLDLLLPADAFAEDQKKKHKTDKKKRKKHNCHRHHDQGSAVESFEDEGVPKHSERERGHHSHHHHHHHHHSPQLARLSTSAGSRVGGVTGVISSSVGLGCTPNPLLASPLPLDLLLPADAFEEKGHTHLHHHGVHKKLRQKQHTHEHHHRLDRVEMVSAGSDGGQETSPQPVPDEAVGGYFSS